jgi:hypothetical protein
MVNFDATTKISFDREMEEYRVRLFINGEYQAGSDYFTDCKIDAKETAKHMKENAFFSELNNETAKEEMNQWIQDSIDLDEWSD